MSADLCPSRIAHESGVVLRCRDVPRHIGNHWTPVAEWTDGDDRELPEYATGGVIQGPRDPGDDTIPVVLSGRSGTGCVRPAYLADREPTEEDISLLAKLAVLRESGQ